MTAPSSHNVTQLLIAWGQGNQAARDELMPLIHAELQRLAHRCLGRERAGHTLQTGALVNEAYLRLVNDEAITWQNRAHFFGIAARLMRQILVDYARHRNYAKRGGELQRVSLDEALTVSDERSGELLALDEALQSLFAFDQRKSQVAELRFFVGLSVAETAEVLQIAPITVMREWRLAKAWLHRELTRGHADEN